MQQGRRYRITDRGDPTEWRSNDRHKMERHNDSNDSDGTDYDEYSYEYKRRSYIRTPNSAGDPRSKAQHSPQRRNHDRHERKAYISKDGSGNYERKPLRSKQKDRHDYIDYDTFATKIQAAFRGYQTRKMFWRILERERKRKRQIISSHKPHYRQDEISLPSMTSIVDNDSVLAVSSNADPNMGLTKHLPTLDSLQKSQILRELKAKLTFSDEIPTSSQLQTGSSPTILLLGGTNPYEAEDFLLGGAMFIYNIQKDKWLFGGTMPEPRNYHGAVYLNGKVYISGGYSPIEIQRGQMLATITMFQLTVRSKRWRRRADMHQARACHGTCVIEENIMVLGGRDNTGKLLSTVEVYYPKRDQWSLIKPMPEAMMGMACSVMDGCVWVMGGIVSEGQYSKYTVSNRVYVFDVTQQSWFQKPSLPGPRAYACSVSLRREIWLWCGVNDSLTEDGFLTSSNTVFVFNPEVAKWEHHSTIGTAKHGIAVAKFGRRVFLLGGMSNVSGSKEVLNESDIYIRENDRYGEGAALPRPVTGAAAVALPIDYVPSNDPKWNSKDLSEEDFHKAATKIQAVYRGYRTRSSISKNQFDVNPSNSQVYNNNYYNPVTEVYNDKWKLFQKVQIEDWPPMPDPKIMSSELNLRLGTLSKGYTVTEENTSGRTKVKRYVQLPEHADPNLGMCGHICNIYKQTKKLLGLRKVEHLPSFARDMLTVTNLQDDSLPVVLLMGGLQPKEPVNLSYGKLIMRYSPLKDRWEYFGVLPEPRNYHAAVYHNNFIYITGGCNPDRRNSGEMVATNTTYCLNIHSSEWIQKADMICYRSYHNLVAYQNRLYAIGGRDHNGRLIASIEAYDIANDKWILKHAMKDPRMGMACAVFQDQIWCIGGIGLVDDSEIISYPVLSSVISYDISNDSWMSRPPLRCPRAYASCVIVQKSMWLFGGASKDRENNCLISMASVDKYIQEDAEWKRVTVLSTPRHCAAVTAVESCVYVFGGVSSQEWSAISKNEMVVAYDGSIHSSSSLPLPLTGVAAVSVPPVLPSLRDESVALLLHAQLTYQ